ncbi:uncharacterized protein LOC115234481 isoform X2 [Formica exsecta]|uniref:uncharacterized protein LOC115234481 isoform X2 n=1 Tax=Formica exsecta TaxID=72781 RepID=UPI0011451985|nr:uncharacterized protein LOC115234481 isoform X2 [Formica exsecta]
MNIDDMVGSEKSSVAGSHKSSSKKDRRLPTCTLCRNHNVQIQSADHKRLCLGQLCICADCCQRRTMQEESAVQTKKTRASKQDEELMKGKKLPHYVLINPSETIKPFLILEANKHLISRQILDTCSIISNEEDLVDSPKPAFFIPETNKHLIPRQILDTCFSTFNEEVSKKRKGKKRKASKKKEEIMELKRVKANEEIIRGGDLDKICQGQDDSSLLFYSKYLSEKKRKTSTNEEEIIEPKRTQLKMKIIFVNKYEENIRNKAKTNEEEIIEPKNAKANDNNLKDLLHYTLYNCLVYDYVRANPISTLVKEIGDIIFEYDRSSSSNEENSLYEAQKRLFPFIHEIRGLMSLMVYDETYRYRLSTSSTVKPPTHSCEIETPLASYSLPHWLFNYAGSVNTLPCTNISPKPPIYYRPITDGQ